MGYCNTAWLTDTHVADVVARQNIDMSLTLLDNEVNGVCQQHGVEVSLIPVDGDGYATSSALINYIRFWMYVEILSNFRGVPDGDIDIYTYKLDGYTARMNKALSKLTKDNILKNQPLNKESFAGGRVIY